MKASLLAHPPEEGRGHWSPALEEAGEGGEGGDPDPHDHDLLLETNVEGLGN